MVQRKRVTTVRHKRRRQRGGALFRRKPRLIDKIAEGASMFLGSPSPSFVKLGAKLLRQAVKGVVDNVKRYKRKR